MTRIRVIAFIICGCALGGNLIAQDRPITRDELIKELAAVRAQLDSLKAFRLQDAASAEDALESFEERLERRFTELENKISSVARATAPVVFNPRTTAFINVAARRDNKAAYNEDGSIQISNRPFLRSVELDFRAPVDPYAEAIMILSLEDEAGEGYSIDPEEVYGLIKQLPILESAPLGMKLKVGKFRAPFGVSNRLHLHDMPWATRPLAVAKFLGTEHGDFFESGFNPVGADFDFFLPNPIPQTTLEMNFDVIKAGDLRLSQQSGISQPAFLGHLNISGDWQNEHILTLGASAYREGGTLAARLFGVDFTYKWAPSEQRSSRSFVLGGELFLGRQRLVDSLQNTRTIEPKGWYAYTQYQVSYWLYLGARYDWVQEPAATLDKTQSIGVYASYYTTEFLRFRVGYESRTSDISSRDGLQTVSLEINFVFGSHPAEPYWVNR